MITGASSGLGEAAARLLSAQGATVVLGARRIERLEELAHEFNGSGGKALAVETDATHCDQVKSLVDTAVQKYGRIDVMLNNAGLMQLSPLEQLKVEEWDNMIDLNIKGVLYGIAAALPHMKQQKAGHIINVSSVAGHKVMPLGAVYCATKYAVRALSEGLRMEVEPYMRGRMSDAPSYAPPVEIGEVMAGGTVAQVERSNLDGFKKGEWVVCANGWQDYAISNGEGVISLGSDPEHPSWAMGVTGMPGFTAWACLTRIGIAKAGETLVVAAATGSVGATVGQIGKIIARDLLIQPRRSVTAHRPGLEGLQPRAARGMNGLPGFGGEMPFPRHSENSMLGAEVSEKLPANAPNFTSLS